MAIKTQSAKAKGRNLQKWVRDHIYHWFPELEEGDVRSTSMGAGGEDILMSPAARKKVPLSIECKSTRGSPTPGMVKQAQSNCPEGAMPVVVWKPHGAKLVDSLVIMKFDDLMKYLRGDEEV